MTLFRVCLVFILGAKVQKIFGICKFWREKMVRNGEKPDDIRHNGRNRRRRRQKCHRKEQPALNAELMDKGEIKRSVNNKKGIAPQVNDQKPHMDGRRIDANIGAGNIMSSWV